MRQCGLQKSRVDCLRKAFALSLIFLLCSCSDNTGEEPGNVAESNKKPAAVSEKFRETQKTYFEDNAIQEERNYRNGTLDGVSKEYYNNGKLRYERFYVDGKLITENEKLYYYSGALLIERNYTNGKLHGTQRTLFDNGQLHEEVYFENGVQTGSSPRYFVNGQVISECIHDDTTNEEVCRIYYENGNIESEKRSLQEKGRPSSQRKTYYRSGTLKTMSNVLDGFGLHQEFYENGTVKIEQLYKADDFLTINEYYTNGQLKVTKRFKGEDKDGIARFYDSDGALNTEQIWQDGTLADEIYYEKIP